ncbi:MAG: phosphate ABC transporter substrate-binding protein, partial [Solirubrobacteraceae bacterium]
MRTRTYKPVLAAVAAALALGLAACGEDEESGGGSASGSGGDSEQQLSGKIAIDGSSTVAPFAQAAAELFNEENPDVQVTV